MKKKTYKKIHSIVWTRGGYRGLHPHPLPWIFKNKNKLICLSFVCIKFDYVYQHYFLINVFLHPPSSSFLLPNPPPFFLTSLFFQKISWSAPAVYNKKLSYYIMKYHHTIMRHHHINIMQFNHNIMKSSYHRELSSKHYEVWSYLNEVSS